MWKNLLKSDLHKSDYNITWKDIDTSLNKLSNLPEEYKNMEGFDHSLTKATVTGGFSADVRNWGVKSVYSFAREMTFVLSVEDTESDFYKDIEISIDNIEDDKDNGKLNPSYIDIQIDMKGQEDPSKFEVKATITWQGEY